MAEAVETGPWEDYQSESGPWLDYQPAPKSTLDVDTSPVAVPERKEQTFGSEHGFVPKFKTTPDSYSPDERERAAAGVDIYSELGDTELRKAIGFSPNENFTADFLARKISEKTGLPADEVVRFGPSGSIEFYNAETKRFTPLDGRNLSMGDLADLYGPSHSIVPAVGLGLLGLKGGVYTSIGAGAVGAFLGEGVRLHRGKAMGVHDMSNEDIFNQAFKVGALDAGFGLGFAGLGELKMLFRKMFKPEGMTPEEARNILSNVGKHKNDIETINEILANARNKQRLIIDPVADAEDILGLELRDAAAKTSNAAKALRDAEIKANSSALDEVARIVNRVDAPSGQVLSNEGDEAIGRVVQRGLRQERARVQAHFDDQLRIAEDDMMRALDELGHSESSSMKVAGGQRARTIVAAYQEELTTRRKGAWRTYQETIGQKIPGDDGFTEAVRYQSKVQIPITKEIAEHHSVVQTARKESLLAGKATGKGALKGVQPTRTETSESLIIGLDGKPAVTGKVTKQNHIDLAVLDDDIKEVRDLLRRGTEGFSSRKLLLAEKQLVKLRNEYLAKNNPSALQALTDAERATTIERTFVDESVFARVLKTGIDGKPVLDDISVFRAVFQEKSGRAMRELVGIARRHPGGEFGLQDAALQFYKANVTKPGSNVILKANHDKFVAEHSEVLTALFPDETMLRFGNLEKTVTRLGKKAERVRKVLNASPLARLGGIAPERMGRQVFAEGISEKNIRQALAALNPEQQAAFKDAVGRHIYRTINTDNMLSTGAISGVIEKHGGKLTVVFGNTYTRDLQALRQMIHINALTTTNKELSESTLIGKFARALITPPLTKRGRLQTWFERVRKNHANEVLNRAVRDENVLRWIVRNGEKDIRNTKVMAVLGQIGGLAIAYDDPGAGDPGQVFNTLPRDAISQPQR